MSSEIVVIEGLIHPAICDFWVNDFDEFGWQAPEQKKGDKHRASYVENVKKHTEIRHHHSALAKQHSEFLIGQLRKSVIFNGVLWPKEVRQFQFNNYPVGGEYGYHSDAASMYDIRTDFTVSVQLSDPNTYKGGEHVFIDGNEEVPYKLKQGTALIYPSGMLHKVTPVTEGRRVAAITWVESRYPDPRARTLVTDTYRVATMIRNIAPHSDVQRLAVSVHENLKRFVW